MAKKGYMFTRVPAAAGNAVELVTRDNYRLVQHEQSAPLWHIYRADGHYLASSEEVAIKSVGEAVRWANSVLEQWA